MLITSAFLVRILPHVFVPVNPPGAFLINVYAGPVRVSHRAPPTTVPRFVEEILDGLMVPATTGGYPES